MPRTLDIEDAYRSHGHLVLRRARSILGDESEAQEVLQEVFLSLVDRPSQFRGTSSAATFLYRMTTNNCLNRIRNSRKRRALLQARGPDERTQPPAGSERTIAAELLAQMPAKLATVAVHYYIDEMTHDEIADILGCSRRMVGKLVARLKHYAPEEAA